MKKVIKLSEIKDKALYKAVIPVETDGSEEYIYVMNPTDSVAEEVINKVISSDDVTELEIKLYLINVLTNVEVDVDAIVSENMSLELTELLFHIGCIYMDILNTYRMDIIFDTKLKKTKRLDEILQVTLSEHLAEVEKGERKLAKEHKDNPERFEGTDKIEIEV